MFIITQKFSFTSQYANNDTNGFPESRYKYLGIYSIHN
jgi:hypothetical protein